MSLPANDPRHGTYNGYQNLACRCPECRAANVEYVRQARIRRRAVLAPDDPRHGRYSTYANHSCRCDACRRANAERERRIRPLRGKDPA